MSNRTPQQDISLLKHALEKLTFRRLVATLVVVIVVLTFLYGYQRAQAVESEYQAAVAQVEAIQQLAESDDIYMLSPEELTWLEGEFDKLERRIDTIERLISLPLGIDRIVGALPWIAPRYDAVHETLNVGRLLAQAGETIAGIGGESLTALDATGIRAGAAAEGETWLDVLQRREPDLHLALSRIDDAALVRAGIDDEYLPERIQLRLEQIDAVLDRFSEQLELADHLPLAYTALGADSTARYLVVFQNPAELRPTGGFIGTIAVVEVHRGQILDYQFHDVYHLSSDYQAKVQQPIDPPWGIAEYVRSDHLQVQDANWWADFPTSAAVLKSMVAQASWPEVQSVVAVQPETIQDLLTVTGPITVDVDGEDREINAGNLHEEAERQRRLRREGGEAEAMHKEVIEVIGNVLIDQLSQGDRADLIDSAFLLFDSLDRRDMQVYQSDPALQSFLEQRNWAGRIEPDPETPTLGTVFANVTGLKTSLAMQPSMHLLVEESEAPDRINASLTITLENLGAEEGDPFYEGFQRYWLDVMLPPGAERTWVSREPVEDPGASNGGAFVVDLPVAERQAVTIDFSMPATDRLLIRRQPGLVSMMGTVEHFACDDALDLSITTDTVLLLDDGCPVIAPDGNKD